MPALENVSIRKMTAADAAQISAIYTAITQSEDELYILRTVEEQARREEDASFVAELDGPMRPQAAMG